jgi:ABC-type nitrate/sulfonate/bicarbonate transport system substrate-binding protein
MAVRTRITIVLAAAAAAAAFLAWRSTRAPLRLTVGTLAQPATGLAFVAEDLGCVGRERLRLEERRFELGRDALVALARGEVDAAVAYDTPVLRSALAGGDVRVLSTLHTSTRNTRVVARREAALRTAADLRHRRIGAARGTNAEFFLETILAFAAIPRDEVTVVDLAPERSVAELAAGRLDAAVLSDPHAGRAAQALGEDGTELRTDLYAEFSFLVTRSDVLASRRDALAALVRALVCADHAAQARPEEAFAAVRRRFPDRDERQLRDAVARVTWEVALDGRAVAVLRREAEWLGRADDRGIDLDRLLDPTLLDAADPEAVNLAMSP